MSSDNTTHQVYRIVNFTTGKVYVGQTHDPVRRRYLHFKSLRKGNHANKHLQNAYNKDGESAFYFEVLETGIPAERIDERETWWINHFDSQRSGYNMTSGGNISSGRGQPCEVRGTWYPSREAAARAIANELGVSIDYASKIIRGHLKKQAGR